MNFTASGASVPATALRCEWCVSTITCRSALSSHRARRAAADRALSKVCRISSAMNGTAIARPAMAAQRLHPQRKVELVSRALRQFRQRLAFIRERPFHGVEFLPSRTVMAFKRVGVNQR